MVETQRLEENPERLLLRGELTVHLEEAIDTRPPGQRAIVMLIQTNRLRHDDDYCGASR